MDFFREKNGRYMADSISGNPDGRAAMRVAMLVLSAGIFAFALFFSPLSSEIEKKTPLYIGFGAVIFSNAVFIFLRRAGFGSGIIVDQGRGTISYRKPGGNRHTVQISSLKSIIITVIPMKASILCLEKAEGGRHVLMYCSDTMKMRMYAGELSSLTSLSLNEETRN